MNVHDTSVDERSASGAPAGRNRRKIALSGLDFLRRQVVEGGHRHDLAIKSGRDTERGIAKRDTVPHDRVEHGLNIRRRARDDTEDLARRRLLLQSLGEVGVLLLQLGEQARILDGDGGLVGEGLHQSDLTVGEQPDLVSIDSDHS